MFESECGVGRRCVRKGMALFCFLVLSIIASAPAMAQGGKSGKTISPAAVNEALGVSAADIQSIDISHEPTGMLRTGVEFDGSHWTIELQPHSLRSDDFRVLVPDGVTGELVEVPVPAPRTYKGFVVEMPGAQVRGSFANGALTATIVTSGGDFGIEPLVSHGFNDADGKYAVFAADSAGVPEGFTCGVADDVHEPEIETLGGDRGTGLRIAEVAIDADFPFYQDNGGNLVNTIDDIENVMNAVEGKYEVASILIGYEITTIVVRTSSGDDPYSGNDCNSMLDQFVPEWNSGFYNGVRRDMTHLFSGRTFAGTCIGIAATFTVCNVSNAYGVSESNFSGNFTFRVGLTAHEMGHNWGALHCNGDADCRIMCSGIGGCAGSPTAFGNSATNSISNFADTRTCLDDLALPLTFPFFDSFSSLSADRWSYNDGGVTTTAGTNPPSSPSSLNLDAAIGNGAFREDEIRSNFIQMNGQSGEFLSYHVQHKGVENGESLTVQYWGSDLNWHTTRTIVSDGIDETVFTFFQDGLPADAYHNEFRIRFIANVNESNDDWFIDDVAVGVAEDIIAPTPNPMSFQTPPVTSTSTTILMVATSATDVECSPIIEYFFEETTGNPGGNNGGWQTNVAHVDTGLTPNTMYSYRVQARDCATPPNETGFSGVFSAVTKAEVPGAPILSGFSGNGMFINPEPATNPVGTEFAIQCTSSPDGTWNGKWISATGTPSPLQVWQTDAAWGSFELSGLQADTEYCFAAQARNSQGTATTLGATTCGSTSATALAAIDQARSCQNHGGTLFCLVFANGEVEPRTPGVTDVEIDFDSPVVTVSATASGSAVGSYAGTITVSAIDADTVNVNFNPALDNQDCWEIVVGGDATGGVILSALRGDIDQNGNTNSADITAIKPSLGLAANAGNFLLDVDANGNINTADITAVKPLLGSGISCP